MRSFICIVLFLSYSFLSSSIDENIFFSKKEYNLSSGAYLPVSSTVLGQDEVKRISFFTLSFISISIAILPLYKPDSDSSLLRVSTKNIFLYSYSGLSPPSLFS